MCFRDYFCLRWQAPWAHRPRIRDRRHPDPYDRETNSAGERQSAAGRSWPAPAAASLSLALALDHRVASD
jgi:hypothetical protein